MIPPERRELQITVTARLLGSLVAVLMILPTLAAEEAGPEIVDDIVDSDVTMGIPPWGPKISNPRTNILWVKFSELSTGFRASVQFQDLSWAPTNGQTVTIGGFIGEVEYGMRAVILPSYSYGTAIRTADKSESVSINITILKSQNRVILEAPWTLFDGVRNGDQFSKPIASGLELYQEDSGSWHSGAIGDYAPNRGPLGTGLRFVDDSRNYGSSYAFKYRPD